MHDVVIRGGTIVDGSGADRYTGDVAISASRAQGRVWASGTASHSKHDLESE